MYVCIICASRSGMQCIFTRILPAGSCTEPWPWLALDTVLAVRSSKACWQRHGPVSLASGTASLAPMMVRLAGTTEYGKPSTSDSKSGTRDGASGTTRYGKPGTGVSLVPVTDILND